MSGPGLSQRWQQRSLSLYLLLLNAACGVRGYPHDVPRQDSADDFAPPLPADKNYGNGSDTSLVDAALDGSLAADGGRDSAPRTPDADSGNAALLDSGLPPAAKSDIELGGVQLRKQDVLAFIHFGHSNMAGRATTPAELLPYYLSEVNPRVWKYHVGKPPEPALEPTARDDSEMMAGPGVALLKQAAERAPKKYFLSLGFGASALYCAQFLPGGLYYTAITEAAIAVKDRVTFAAIVIMLGSTEIHGRDADRAGFPECVNTLVTAIREAVGQPDLPMLLSGYEMESTGLYAATGEFATQIIPQIEKVPSIVSNSAIVPADGLGMQDNHHFDLNGHMVWTQRLLDIMKAKGWAPWMTR